LGAVDGNHRLLLPDHRREATGRLSTKSGEGRPDRPISFAIRSPWPNGEIAYILGLHPPCRTPRAGVATVFYCPVAKRYSRPHQSGGRKRRSRLGQLRLFEQIRAIADSLGFHKGLAEHKTLVVRAIGSRTVGDITDRTKAEGSLKLFHCVVV